MISNFAFNNTKIILKNTGEYFGKFEDFEYNIGEKLYNFSIMKEDDFGKLKKLYNELIDFICKSKESTSKDEKIKYFFDMSSFVSEILDFSPYTHYYTQALIDIIIKTYNSGIFRTDLLFKYKINVNIENPLYYQNEEFENTIENNYYQNLLFNEWITEPENISEEKHNEYFIFFKAIRDLLISEFRKKSYDLERRLELMSDFSQKPFVRNLRLEDKLYLYETKRIFDLDYINIEPNHAIFLDTKFKVKYIYNQNLSCEEEKLDAKKIIELMKEKNIKVEEVYELESIEDQIRFELFKVIENNFSINKCQNCGRLFIPKYSQDDNEKGRFDQKYCKNIYKDTGKTCNVIGPDIARRKKFLENPILAEYRREYKRMHALHTNHSDNSKSIKKFTQTQFDKWSNKSKKLRDNYHNKYINMNNDKDKKEIIEKFKMDLKTLSYKYYIPKKI